MKRYIPIGMVILALLAAGVFWGAFGGCQNRSPKTRIAERKTYDAPAPVVAAGTVEDWPKWRGPRGDGVSRETALADTWPEDGPPQLWSAEVGLGYSSPVAAAGRVYLFSNNDGKETLTAFDANSGRIIWNDESPNDGWNGSYAGTRATPMIADDSIYTYGGAGELVSRDLATGKPRWRLNVLKETGAKNLGWGTASSPLVANGLVYVQSGKGGAVAVAVRADSGAVAWQSEAKGVSGYAHPLLVDVGGTPQLIIFGGENLYGIDPGTGKTIWSERWETSYDVNSTTPVYRDGHLFVSSGYGHGCMMLYLSPTGASKLWQGKQIASKYPGVILDGDSLYGNSEGAVVCISWPDGAVRWSADDSKLKIGAGGTLVRAEDKLILMSERGKLSLTRATPQGITLLSQADAIDGREVWSTPLLYGGRLYAKGTAELICFDVSGQKAPVAGVSEAPPTP